MARVLVAVLVVIVGVSFRCLPAHADEDGARRAGALFDEARTLMRQGAFETACPKLEESQALDPGLGTLSNLGVCYERSGRTASAWRAFREVLAQATARGDDERRRYAAERVSALGAILPRVVIFVADAASHPTLRVWCDRKELEKGSWGVEFPIDPGNHELEARDAVGGPPWRERFDAVAGELVTIRVAPPPEKVDAPARAAVPTPALPTKERTSWQRPTAVVLGGLAGASFAVGTVAAFLGVSRYEEANRQCQGDACSERGLALRSEAQGLADIGTVSLVAGSILLAGGVVLWLTGAPRRASSQR